MLGALSFTLLEAGLSAGLSIVLGVLLAHFWVRLRVPAKAFWESLLILPFFCPPLFVILAVVRVFGKSGIGFSIYGLNGIVLAHVILNAPLAFYLLLQAWRRTAPETIMLAQNMDNIRGLVERPLLRGAIPQAFWLIFLYCSLSFTIVLTLGGGPNSTTLEIAIFQAMRYDYNLTLAFALSMLQALLGVAILLILRRDFEPPLPALGELALVPMNSQIFGSFLGVVIVGLIGTFLIVPLGFVLIDGAVQIPHMTRAISSSTLKTALANSLGLSALFALGVIAFSAFLYHVKASWLAWLIASISPLVISTLAILVLRLFTNPFHWGIALVLLIQILTLSPLFVRLWRDMMKSISPEELSLLAGLTDAPKVKFRLFYLPRLLAPIIRMFGLALALAMGDLALFPLFAPSGFVNLPMLIWQLIASYQFDAAMAMGAVMLLVIAMLLGLAMFLAKNWEKRYA